MVGRGGLVAVGRGASVAVGASPALGVEDVRAEEAGVSDSAVARCESGMSVGSAVARSESGMSVGSAVARAGRSVGSSEPPQASSSNGRSSASAKTPSKSRGVLISNHFLCLWVPVGVRHGRSCFVPGEEWEDLDEPRWQRVVCRRSRLGFSRSWVRG